MLPCLETPDPHQLTLPGKRLSAKIEAVADADFFFFFFFVFWVGETFFFFFGLQDSCPFLSSKTAFRTPDEPEVRRNNGLMCMQ